MYHAKYHKSIIFNLKHDIYQFAIERLVPRSLTAILRTTGRVIVDLYLVVYKYPIKPWRQIEP